MNLFRDIRTRPTWYVLGVVAFVSWSVATYYFVVSLVGEPTPAALPWIALGLSIVASEVATIGESRRREEVRVREFLDDLRAAEERRRQERREDLERHLQEPLAQAEARFRRDLPA